MGEAEKEEFVCGGCGGTTFTLHPMRDAERVSRDDAVGVLARCDGCRLEFAIEASPIVTILTANAPRRCVWMYSRRPVAASSSGATPNEENETTSPTESRR